MHALVLALLAGLAINSHNTGGVDSASEFVADTKAAIETAQPYDSGVLKNSDTGNFGNP